MSAVRLGANRFMRDWTYVVRMCFARSKESVISQARYMVFSSEAESSRPRVVVASTITTIKVGPSSIDLNEALTRLSVL